MGGHGALIVEREQRGGGDTLVETTCRSLDLVNTEPAAEFRPLSRSPGQLIAIRRGIASFAFLSVRVSTPSSSCALICCWSILFDKVNDRAKWPTLYSVYRGVHTLVLGMVDAPLDAQNTILDVDVQRLLVDGGKFYDDGQRVRRLEYVRGGYEVAGRNGLLFLRDQLLLFLNFERLRCCHHVLRRVHPRGAPAASSHGYRFRLIPLGAREIEGQNPVSVFGLDPVRVDFDRYRDRTIEPSGEPLATMQRCAVAVLDGLAAGNADCVALDLDIEVLLVDAGQLGDQHDIVTLPKDVERRVC